MRDNGSRDTLPNPAGSGLDGTAAYFAASFAIDASGTPSSLLYQIALNGSTSLLASTNPSYASTTWNGTQTAPALGMNPYNSGGPLLGDIAEVILYDRVLTTAERQGVEEYLYAKYFIPEPTTLSLLALGGLGLLARRRRK